jgi:hypothetical protein
VNGSGPYTVTASTGTGSGTLGLNLVDDDSIQDAASNRLGGTGVGNGTFAGQVYTIDKIAPTLTTLEMLDVGTDGRVDRVDATFSETLATYTAGNAPWTFSGVPSNGSLATVSVSTSTATLEITEGAHDTAVGSFSIALAASASGIRDAAGNQASFAATSPTDGAQPVLLTLVDTDGATNGRFETSDTLTVTFSEPVTIPQTSSNVVLTEGNGGNTDALNVPGLLNLFNTGADGYLTSGNNRQATFTGSTVDQPTTSSVRVTPAACNASVSTTCTMATEATGGTFTVTPVSGITDAAGNTATGSVQKTTFRIF